METRRYNTLAARGMTFLPVQFQLLPTQKGVLLIFSPHFFCAHKPQDFKITTKVQVFNKRIC